ncbi:hypothetical protein [Acidovorax sp. A1169]|uniref:hypothetical protein n=1 Tax=Acidovorax sp. A1169 TaxID=3059524 RepID=UPI002737921E|nr:hypothetical protein [Acidovorax sp. A1169]MDP4078336.1 hypothetical protein [Acidovorax sp. A1169]
MNKTIKSQGGITVRFIEALNGFKTKFGYWPETLEVSPETLAMLATTCLTPLGFFLLQSKVELVINADEKILAKGARGETFDYGEEGWQSPDGHRHDALMWLGLDEDIVPE